MTWNKLEKNEILRKIRHDFINILNTKAAYVSSEQVYKWTDYTENDIKNTIESSKDVFVENEDYIINTKKYLISMDLLKFMCMTIPNDSSKRFRQLFKEVQHNYVDELLDELAFKS